jgi:S-adenosylmethionine synthetase
MTMESVAGKNPMTHVGKLYNVAAGRIASALVGEVDAIAAAQCALVSQIGTPVAEPQVVDIRIATADDEPVERLRGRVAEIVRDGLDGIAELWQEIVNGEVRLY